MARTGTEDRSVLEAALIGYQAQRADITAKMTDIQRRIGGKSAKIPVTLNGARPHKKHRISAEGRARIAAAQRRRWAVQKKAAAG